MTSKYSRGGNGYNNSGNGYDPRNDPDVRNGRGSNTTDAVQAKLEDLDEYLEMLYQVSSSKPSAKQQDDGLKLQIAGTRYILELCRDVMNLEQLIQNNTVMGALTRVLQDEHKKSLELTFNILRIFLAFSNFMEMHQLITNYKIGALTMKVIEFELSRRKLREEEKYVKDIQYDTDINALKQSLAGAMNVSSSSAAVTTSAVASGAGATDATKIQDSIAKLRKLKTKENTEYQDIMKKQQKVLFVSFYILLNLAQDIGIEVKMIRKDLIQLLLTSLDMSFNDLLVLVMTFLKKVSIFEENKAILKESSIVAKLSKFLTCSSNVLINATLRLLFNMSFDAEVRDQILKAGLVPKLVHLLKTPSYRSRTLKLLYHLSVDDRCKSMITYTDAIPILMGFIINFPQPSLTKELAAVVINFSYNSRSVELMLNSHGLNYLMDRFENTKDVLLLKIVRNIATWTFNQHNELENPEVQYRYRGLWSPHIRIFFSMLSNQENHDLLVELLGCISQMTTDDLPANMPWSKLIKEYNLLSMFSKLLVPGMSQSDLILEIVLILSNMTADPAACDLIACSNLINQLYQIWKEKSDDIEIQLQLLFCFYKLILNDKSREEVLYSTRVVIDIIECLSHRLSVIRHLADKFCELVLEYDRKPNGELGQLGLQIRKKRFESYNQGWLVSSEYVDSEQHFIDHEDLISLGQNQMYSPAPYHDDVDYDDPLDWRNSSMTTMGEGKDYKD